MYLYSLTLQRAGGIVCATNGNFVGGKTQEIVVGRGKNVDLLRPDESGKLQTLLSVEVFGAIRSLAQFRLTGSQKDYVVVGSDSGRLVILEYSRERNLFHKVRQETFGKSGCRRIVPGQFLAVDHKGRACMIAACEKQKLVYVLNRDAAARLTISSPLEAHKSHTITYSVVGVDCGFDNPIFAAIELDYAESDLDPTGQAAADVQKHLTFYELDLGLNHVSRKWSEPVDNGANLLVTVPGGGDGPAVPLYVPRILLSTSTKAIQMSVRLFLGVLTSPLSVVYLWFLLPPTVRSPCSSSYYRQSTGTSSRSHLSTKETGLLSSRSRILTPSLSLLLCAS